MSDNHTKPARIRPIDLRMGSTVYTTSKQENNPVKVLGKKYFFYDVDALTIQKLELAKVGDVPGMKINDTREDATFVSLDDTSLYDSRDFCIELAKEFNTKALSEIVEARDKAEQEFHQYDEAAKTMGDIVKHMK